MVFHVLTVVSSPGVDGAALVGSPAGRLRTPGGGANCAKASCTAAHSGLPHNAITHRPARRGGKFLHLRAMAAKLRYPPIRGFSATPPGVFSNITSAGQKGSP